MKIKITKGDNSVGRLFQDIPSIQSEAEYKKLMIVKELLEFMKEKRISRSALAKRMGVQSSRITSMLDGSNNFTIETLVRAGRAVGAELHQTFAPIGSRIRWTACDPAETHQAFVRVTPRLVPTLKPEFDLDPVANDDDSKAA